MPDDDGTLQWELMHIGHASFQVTGPGGVLMIDPMLEGRFWWEEHWEKQLDAPAFQLPCVERCSAVVITHNHGDHYEANTVRALIQQHGATVLAPHNVVEDMESSNVAPERLRTAQPGETYEIGPFRVSAYPNRDSEHAQPCLRFSYALDCGGRTIFHSGDSHGPSPAWEPLVETVDVALLWPSQIADTVQFLRPKTVVLMHYGAFTPGEFLCNRNPEELAQAVRQVLDGADVRTLAPGNVMNLA